MAEPSILGALRDPQFRSDTLRNLVEALNGAKRSLTVGSLGAVGDMGNTLANLVRAGAGTAYHEATGRPIPQALEYRDPARDFGTSASLGNFAERQGWLPPQTYSMPEQAGALLGPIAAMKAPDLAQSTLRGLVSALKSEPSRRMVEGYMGGMGAQPNVIAWHGTTNTTTSPGAVSGGDEQAKRSLVELANRYGIKEWADAPSIFERWLKMGMADQFGVTPEIAGQARDLYARAQKNINPPVESIGFDSFNMPNTGRELGAHFGTKQQAEMMGTPFPFDVDIKAPLRLPDLGTWKPQDVMKEATRSGVKITPAERQAVLSAQDQNSALRNLLEAKGYDGVVYQNKAEGAGDSYIAFKNEQIKKLDKPPR